MGDLTWDKIAVSLPRSEKLRSLVLAGVPHSMRPQVRWGPEEAMRIKAPRGLSAVPLPQLWMRLSGALQKKRNSELSYREIVKNSSNDETIAAKQVRPCGGRPLRGGPGELGGQEAALGSPFTPTAVPGASFSLGSSRRWGDSQKGHHTQCILGSPGDFKCRFPGFFPEILIP